MYLYARAVDPLRVLESITPSRPQRRCAQCTKAEIQAKTEPVTALRAIAGALLGRIPPAMATTEGDDRLVVQDVARRKLEEMIARFAEVTWIDKCVHI